MRRLTIAVTSQAVEKVARMPAMMVGVAQNLTQTFALCLSGRCFRLGGNVSGPNLSRVRGGFQRI